MYCKDNFLYVSGWKEISLVDVLGSISFTLWTSFCNLKCPWCGNSHVARGYDRKKVYVNTIFKRINEVKDFLDYFHVTGGEPTLQHKALLKLFKMIREETSLSISLDTNGSNPHLLEKLLPFLDHIAMDIKAPFSDMYKYSLSIGLSAKLTAGLIPRILESIKLALKVPFVEFRTTLIPGLISEHDVIKIGRELEKVCKGKEVVFVIQQYIPYEHVMDAQLRSFHRTEPERVKAMAKSLSENVSLKVYYRTIEEGTRRIK